MNVRPVHCTLATTVCDGDAQCKADKSRFVQECERELQSAQCPAHCATHFRTLLTSTPMGGALADCSCWSNDTLCSHFHQQTLAPCLLAQMATTDATPPRPNTSRDNNDTRQPDGHLQVVDERSVQNAAIIPRSATFSSCAFTALIILTSQLV